MFLESSPDNVYIGRPGEWGNPFRVGANDSKESVIAKYRAYINNKPGLKAKIHELGGKTMGCWCSGNCHGEVL